MRTGWWPEVIDDDGNLVDETSSRKTLLVQVVILAIGLALGWEIGGNRKEAAAFEWAVQEARRCEAGSHQVRVSACLDAVIRDSDAERLDEARADGNDPRR